MNAKDLMIGDWVQGFLPDTYSQVCGIINECQVAIMSGGAYMEVSNEDIRPIPLTPEILEKNGFTNGQFYGELLYSRWQIQADCFSIRFRREDTEEGGSFRCKYVHELQHALRLCGIDKEIVLP